MMLELGLNGTTGGVRVAAACSCCEELTVYEEAPEEQSPFMRAAMAYLSRLTDLSQAFKLEMPGDYLCDDCATNVVCGE